jgi:hypothetical protein
MLTRCAIAAVVPALFATYIPSCGAPGVAPTVPAELVETQELWRPPADIDTRNLFGGPWGADYAPDPEAIYTFVKTKTSGVNPGMTVTDPLGRKWSVKQAPHDGRGAEGPVEVVLSRVLSAVGYHQPPVYYLPSFSLADTFGTRVEAGGRFRLEHPSLKEVGNWSWQKNPFVGTRPYQGLLAILMLFNSSDLKNSNNTIYRFRASSGRVERWYVVRDLGTALGEPARMRPLRNDPEAFERIPFFAGVENGFVVFDYRGWHDELVSSRLTPEDVRWASELLAQLSDQQWHEAFSAGGYERTVAQRFVRRIREKLADGLSLDVVAD